MRCESCEKAEATIHVKTVVDGRKREMHLCAPCAESGILELQPAAIADAVQQLFTAAAQSGLGNLAAKSGGRRRKDPATGGGKCEICGMTQGEFHKKGRLGCAHDYSVFESELIAILKKIHGADHHVGRIPNRAQGAIDLSKNIEKLRRDLDDAVRNEHYEEAAKLRDRLRDLERGVHDAPSA